MKKPKIHVVNFSGGKDSTAMLLRMLELEMRVDVILYCDTSVEFPAMQEHIKKVSEYIQRPIKILKNKKDFEYFLLNHEFTPKYGGHSKGFSFPTPRIRWCTKELKTNLLEKYKKKLEDRFEVINYIGIASDELYRLERNNNKKKNVRYPLVEWGWTEKDALEYCYKKGFDFGGLYKIFDRVSCWCCPLQSLEELRKLRKNFPDLWGKLMDWQEKTWRKFKTEYSVQELDRRFEFEEIKIERGESITTKAFYNELKNFLITEKNS